MGKEVIRILKLIRSRINADQLLWPSYVWNKYVCRFFRQKRRYRNWNFEVIYGEKQISFHFHGNLFSFSFERSNPLENVKKQFPDF